MAGPVLIRGLIVLPSKRLDGIRPATGRGIPRKSTHREPCSANQDAFAREWHSDVASSRENPILGCARFHTHAAGGKSDVWREHVVCRNTNRGQRVRHFDAGTGIRNLGRCLVEEAAGEPVKVQLFLTHFHWDHIQGIPFFAPIYGRGITSPLHRSEWGPLQEILEGQMAKPYFPVDFAQVAARRNFNLIEPGESVSTCGMKVTPFPLNHPQERLRLSRGNRWRSDRLCDGLRARRTRLR